MRVGSAEERNRRGEEERECVRGYSEEKKVRSRKRAIAREIDRKRENRLKECERRNS